MATAHVASAIFRKSVQLAIGGNIDLARFPERRQS
jgi:hypothetical protein